MNGTIEVLINRNSWTLVASSGSGYFSNTSGVDIIVRESTLDPGDIIDTGHEYPTSHLGTYTDTVGLWLRLAKHSGKQVDSAIILVTNPVNSSSDFYTEVVKGNVPGHSIAGMQGVNNDVDTASRENLWCSGGMMTYPTSGEQWEIVSNDAADTSAGTGLQTALLVYYDSNYDQQFELITMNGVTPVATVATDCFRFIALVAQTVGSSRWNLGEVIVTVVSAGANRGCIRPLGNLSLHGFYTVPKGKTAYIIYGSTDVGKNKDCQVSLLVSSGGNTPFLELPWGRVYQNTAIISPIAPIAPSVGFTPTGAIPEKSEIMFTCKAEVNNSFVRVLAQFLLVDN